MKYVALYALTEKNFQAAIAVWKEMAASDSYYGMYGGGGTPFVSRSSDNGLWGDWYAFGNYGNNLQALVDEATSDDVLYSVACHCVSETDTVGWWTCAGNYVGLRIREDGILIKMEGARHGIPSYYLSEFENQAPIKVFKYDSMRPETSPFASGLAPSSEIMDREVNRLLAYEPDIATMPVLKAEQAFKKYLRANVIPESWIKTLAHKVNLSY